MHFTFTTLINLGSHLLFRVVFSHAQLLAAMTQPITLA